MYYDSCMTVIYLENGRKDKIEANNLLKLIFQESFNKKRIFLKI